MADPPIKAHLHNTYIRDVISTIGKKVVLIVGEFSESRLDILEAIRDVLRQYHYFPVFLESSAAGMRPKSETIALLAQLVRYVLVDVTEPGPALEIAGHIMRNVAVPIQPMVWQSALASEDALGDDYLQTDALLPMYGYTDIKDIWTSLHTACLVPAEAKAKMLLDLMLTS